jgi:patatin-related protein
MPSAPLINPTQEVRFAVVMYGGLSLCIYMNGVAQEMLNLVRATAPATDAPPGGAPARAKSDLRGTELVYRKLGQMLQRGKPTKSIADIKEIEGQPPSPILTRFIVDVISGTSAGGINGVFLAKALANDQDMRQLKELWIEEGDFGKLMNEHPANPAAPQIESILSGRRIYRKLLDALEGMEGDGKAGADTDKAPFTRSPYVKELDLYITTTDISGLTMPLRLSDRVIFERRRRNVLHFSYAAPGVAGEPRNDFSRRFNPFLAFAARCTSAFPFAFEPMKLGDIDDAVRANGFYKRLRKSNSACAREGAYLSGDELWERFYAEYLDDSGGAPGTSAAEFAQRSFADGGILDNKPFSYATDALLRRHADVPVDRRLIYVEPDPESPETMQAFDPDIDVAENTLSALAPTVSTETIREDIQRILSRNRLIDRLNRYTAEIDDDMRAWEGEARARGVDPADHLSAEQWAEQDLDYAIQKKGVAYGGYHRIRVAAVTEDLTRIVSRALAFDADSDWFIALRGIVRAWRSADYVPRRTQGMPKSTKTENRFLIDFDLQFRLRRLNFLRSKIDELSCLMPDQLKNNKQLKKWVGEALIDNEGWRAGFQKALRDAQGELSAVYQRLLLAPVEFQRRVTNPDPPNPLAQDFAATGIDMNALLDILDQPEDRREAFAEEYVYGETAGVPQRLEALRGIARKISGKFLGEFRVASQATMGILDPGDAGDTSPESVARKVLLHYYDTYENYDMVSFPVAYQADIGEADVVKVLRVSPFDTKTYEEMVAKFGRDNVPRKLAGTSLGHFGAFFDRSWRENDIMWGRLDAADRLITSLLPPKSPDAAALIREAHEAIISEELMRLGGRDMFGKLVAAMVDAGANLPEGETIKKLRAELTRTQTRNPELQRLLATFLDKDTLLDYVRGEYEVDLRPDPQTMVNILARSTKVFGKMLETLAEKHRVESRRVAWVTRLGRVFWGLVEVAVPGSFFSLLFRHWIKLLYVFELFLIVGGILLLDRDTQRFGFVALAATAVTHLVVAVLGDYMRGARFRFLRSLGGILALLAAALFVASAALGFGRLFDWLRDQTGRVAVNNQVASALKDVPQNWQTPVVFTVLVVALIFISYLLGGGVMGVRSILDSFADLSDRIRARLRPKRARDAAEPRELEPADEAATRGD